MKRFTGGIINGRSLMGQAHGNAFALPCFMVRSDVYTRSGIRCPAEVFASVHEHGLLDPGLETPAHV